MPSGGEEINKLEGYDLWTKFDETIIQIGKEVCGVKKINGNGKVADGGTLKLK